MAQIECGRGHLYDPDKYPACPYCGGGQKIKVVVVKTDKLLKTIDFVPENFLKVSAE